MTRTIEYSYLDFHEAVYELNGSHTTKIAEKVGCNRITALLRLKFMASMNVIFGEKRGPVWFWYSNDDFTYDDFNSFLLFVESKKRKRSSYVQIQKKPKNPGTELIDPFLV